MQQKRIASLAGTLVIFMSAVRLLTSCLQSHNVLEGNAFKRGDIEMYFYFSGGVVYAVQNHNSQLVKYNIGTYKGKTVNVIPDGSSEAVVKEDGIELFRIHLKRVTDQAFITKIKKLPVSKR